MPLPFPKKDIPRKITPCPIIDTSAEIRFTPNVPAGAVFGILYSAFQQEYPGIEVLPVQNIPEEIRINNPDLMYQPHYKIQNEAFTIQIGPQVLSIGCANNYPGWTTYSKKVVETFIKIKDYNIAHNITRLGLRYINFFDDVDIFAKLDQEVSADNKLFIGHNSLLRTEIRENDLINTLQISNSGSLIRNGENIFGSIIDIDISKIIHLENFFEGINEQVSGLHNVGKEIFFGLLDGNYLKTFSPKYE
jgi:uncharacterized protein (TIGR04255 family)